MKKILITLALALICVRGYSQTNVTSTVTNSPILGSPVLTFLTTGTNWAVIPYPIYDETDHTWGAGIALAAKINDYFWAVTRLDFLHGEVFTPSLSAQMQAPIKILGKFEAIPLVYSGIGTSFNSTKSTDGNPIGIFGTGLAIKTGAKQKWLPVFGIVTYEHWTGGGFNDNQWRAALGWEPF